MTFEELQKVNETIVITPIERKDKKTGETIVTEYAPVNQRIKAFRMVHPDGTIKTRIDSMIDGVVVMTAEIYDESGRLLGTGTAYENETSNYINKTSYIENCETSAVGRALGMCGFGIDTSIASAEEMQNALHEQAEEKSDEKGKTDHEQAKTEPEEAPTTLPQEMIATLEECIPRHGGTLQSVCKYYHVKRLCDMTVEQFKDCMDRMGENQ